MTEERVKKIKRIFNSYVLNKSLLSQVEFPTIKGVAFDNISVKGDKSKNTSEQMVIKYLVDKEKLIQEIKLVDDVYEYFADDRDIELAHLIDFRFRQGNYHWKASNDCYISERQGIRWLEKAYEKADKLLEE